MFNIVHQTILLVVLVGGFLVPGISGISVYTMSEVEAVNGTDVRLRCTFRSSYPVSLQSVSVVWFFRPLHRGPEEAVVYYREKPYLPTEGRFKGHVVWSGDVVKNEASIVLQQVSPDFNGTYFCQVLNIPDVHGRKGEIVLRVINPARFDLLAWIREIIWN